jgi:hypothetical protein
MLVFVRSHSGTTWEFQLSASSPVNELKQLISKRTPLPPWKQNLLFGTTLLEDDRTLADYGLDAESTLSLVHRVDRQREDEMNRCMPIIIHVCAALQLHEDFAVELYLFGFSSDTAIPFMYDAARLHVVSQCASNTRCSTRELMISAGARSIWSS